MTSNLDYSSTSSDDLDGGIKLRRRLFNGASGDSATLPPPAAPIEVEPLPSKNLGSLEGIPVPQRRSVLSGRIHVGEVAGLSGDGGAGKNTLACQFCVQVARRDMTEKSFLGYVIEESGPALLYTSEEPDAEMHFRFDAVRHYYGLSWSDLADIEYYSAAEYPDLEPALAAWNRQNNELVPTETFKRLRKKALKLRPKFIYVENASDCFNVDEIVRKQARDSVFLLKRLAAELECGIWLGYQPSLAGIASGSGRSGSTQWRNAMRSHAYLTTEEPDRDIKDAPHLKRLQFNKNNRGPTGEMTHLVWTEGLLLPPASASSAERITAEQAADQMFLSCLIKADLQGFHVSHKVGPTYAPAAFAKMEIARNARLSVRALADGMQRLLDSGQIRVETSGPPSKLRTRLVKC